MEERYEAAARELGDKVAGLMVVVNGWTMEVVYDDEDGQWIAAADVVVHQGEQQKEHHCVGRGASPTAAADRCVYWLEKATD